MVRIAEGVLVGVACSIIGLERILEVVQEVIKYFA